MPEPTDTPNIKALIAAVDAADSFDDLVDAVKAVAETGSPEALPTLVAALNFNNPGAAVAAVDGFILIGEPAVDPLLTLLDNQNYGARAWALRALAGIGDPRALTLLIETAKQDYALSVRRAAARGLGTIRWHLVPVAELANAQQAALEALQAVTQDPEWVVRYAAIAGLQSLAESLAATRPETVPVIVQQLQTIAATDEDLGVQSRARMAQQQLARLSKSILFSEEEGPPPPSVKNDWQMTLDKLYRRKFDERRPTSHSEGDPQKFRAVASQIQSERTEKAKKKQLSHPVNWRWLWSLSRKLKSSMIPLNRWGYA